MKEARWPLEGVRVVDFGHYVAGPLAGMLLADQGADVVKVDRPGDERVFELERVVYDRGKKRVELDLKSGAGLEAARKLIDLADVVIENFRPGVMDRLGLGAEETTKRNHRLIYLSLPGFAATDPKYSLRAFEGVIGAATAQYTDLRPGGSRQRPIYTPIGLGSTYGALHAAIAALMALYRREDTGQGEVIEVPLSGAAMSAMAVLLMKAETPPPRYASKGPSPFMASFQGGDGKWLFWIAGGHSRNTLALVKALGIYDDLIADGLVNVPVYENLTLDNNLPDSSNLTQKWNERIADRMRESLKAKPAGEWQRLINEAGVPCALHRSAADWLDASETDAAELTIETEHENFGKVRQFGTQVSLSDTPEFDPTPAREADVDQILDSWERSFASRRMTDFSHDCGQRAVLEGIRVLDLSNVLAGPACARTLAEYGADVIKIDTMHPYFGTRVYNWFPIEVSPGKRSLLLDVKRGHGREIFDRLADSADVIVHNFRPGVAERLGIDFNRLQARNPKLIYLNITAMDGPSEGPWSDRPGFDPMVQAATGVQVRYGGDGTPVLHGWASCIDYITGYAGTFGVVLGLLRMRRFGIQGALTRTSLAMGSQLVQAPYMFCADGHPTGLEPHGQEAVGEHSLYRIYEAQDGWLFLAGGVQDLERLSEVEGLGEVPVALGEEARADFLASRIASGRVAVWVDRFVKVGFGCHRVDNVEDIRTEYLHDVNADGSGVWDDGRSISAIRIVDHPCGTPIDICPPAYARFRSGSGPKLCAAGPGMGEHTREILKAMDFVDREIDGFVASGAVKEAFHQHYLPR